MQVGAGYLIDEHFLKMYTVLGSDYLFTEEFWHKYGIGQKQAQYDRTYLFGMIVSTSTNAYNKSITKYKATQDGILTWMELQKLYAHDGSKELKLGQLQAKLQVPYIPGQKGGLSHYIDQFQDTMERVEDLAPEPQSDWGKKQLLIRNIKDGPEYLVMYCRNAHEMSYEEVAVFLRSNAIQNDSKNRSSRRKSPNAMLAAMIEDDDNEVLPKSQFLNMEDTISLVNTMTKESSLVQVYQALSTSKYVRDGLSIHPDIWHKLDQAMKEKILEIRRQIRDEKGDQNGHKNGNNGGNKPVPKAPVGSLPAQYPSMINSAQQISSLLKLSSADIESSDEETDDEDLLQQLQITHLSTVTDDIEVRAHFEYSEVYNDKVFAISDGGADSCVLGRHAHIIHHTGRTATLVGYDPRTTRTTKVPIVSAYLKVKSHIGVPVFLKINQAPYHKDNSITLISEYQVREHQYVIDSIATKHLKAPNTYGTQRLDLSSIIHINFEDRGGIMGFELLEITNEDFDAGEPIYDVFEITGQDTWVPKHFQTALQATTNEESKETEGTELVPNLDYSMAMNTTCEVDGSKQPDNHHEDHNDEMQLSIAHMEYHPEQFVESNSTEVEPSDVDEFLRHLTYEDLTANQTTNPEYFGYPSIDKDDDDTSNDHFDTFAFAMKSWHRVLYDQIDPKKVQPYLGFRPLAMVKATLQATTQMARMVIRSPMRRHYKARAPHLNVNRLDEPVSTDPAYANCNSLHHGFVGFQVFFGMMSHHINVYGFRRKNYNFPKIYRDFIKENGAPSVLRRDNARAEQSEEIQNIHRELYIKDQFSKVENQHQNPVESQAIKWLKQGSHVLLDRTGAPDSAWYFAVKYMADIHNICYDKSLDMCPKQRRFGSTVDISAFLQFTFWQRVLYLDHEESFPHSKERTGYWVGVADNVGDSLTYWIYDDQAKRLFARSVVRPFNNNKRVKWDPAFASISPKNTAKIGGDSLPSKKERDKKLANIMDHYDKYEEEPIGQERIENMIDPTENEWTDYQRTKTEKSKQDNNSILGISYPEDTGFDTEGTPFIPVEREDSYEGDSRLRYGNNPMEIDPDIPRFPQSGRESYNDISYEQVYEPPDEETMIETDPDNPDRGDHEDRGAMKQDQIDKLLLEQKQTVKPRRSKQLKSPSPNESNILETRSRTSRINQAVQEPNKTIWTNNKWHKFLKVVVAIGIQFVPSHVMAMPSSDLKAEMKPLIVKQIDPISTAHRVEELRAYHLNLDRMNQLLDPDEAEDRWRINKVLKHRLVTSKDRPERVFVKVKYVDSAETYMPLDVLRTHDPLLGLIYAQKHDLLKDEHWKWTEYYTKDNPFTSNILNIFKASTVDNGKKFKFGVEVPRNPKHAIAMDKAAGNTGWQDSMNLETGQLNDFKVFKVVPDDHILPREYKRIPYQMIFDVKFDGRLKSRLVASGHRTPNVPREDVFSGVVSMEAVRLGFILAHLNGLLVCAGDIGNAFLNGTTREKVFIIAGPEFGPDLEGKRLLIDKSLYGLKTSAARFHEHCSAKLLKMGFRPSKADPDLWMKRLKDGTYEYMARFVDDLIAFSKRPMELMKELEQTYVMKGVGKPIYYLGGDVVDLPPEWESERCRTAFSASTYIKNCIPKLADMCGKKTFKQAKTPFSDAYHAEIDTSPLCDTEKISRYKSLIGSANWIITLGRFDIAYAVSTLSRYCVAPRDGHFEAMERVFGYLDKFPEGKLVIDPTEPKIRQVADFSFGHSWSEFYPDAAEDIPSDMPPSQGELATLTCYVDADHARDKVTCRSVTGIVMLLNNTPITWMSKRQQTVETSTYGLELVAARIAVDLIIEMRYKLRMLGVVLEESSVLVGDNMAVVINTTLPSSSLKKKHQACNYHRVREAIAARFIKFGYIHTSLNLADICTKPLGSQAFHDLLKEYMFRRPISIDLIPSKSEKALISDLMDTTVSK